MSIPRYFIDDVLARVDIVEIIDQRVRLRKAGNNFVARCPFHEEKTPSFSVNQSKQFYYCFGCGANGNAIGFLMQHDHMHFVEAVEFLASHLGLELPKEAANNSSNIKSETNKKSYTLLANTSSFYKEQLAKSKAAQNYLKERGLSEEISHLFAIGYAPALPKELESYLNHVDKTNAVNLQSLLLENGLLKKNDTGEIFERFRNRIMFPIRDPRGQVIAFGGRSLGRDLPKYLNSPETPLFHKGDTIYGLFEARSGKQKLEEIIVVEGYMDVVALVQYGVSNVVATMGTAVTTQQIQQLLRNATKLVFCFDGDRAGQAAAWRALEITLPLLHDGITIKFLFLPETEDPDSYIRKNGLATFMQNLAAAKPLSDFLFDHLGSLFDMSTLEGRAALAKQAKTLLSKIQDGVLQKLLLQKLAKFVRIDIEKLEDENFDAPTAHQESINVGSRKSLSTAETAISLLLAQPKLALEVADPECIRRLDLPHTGLLVWLCELIKKNPELGSNIGIILENCTNQEEGQLLAELAAQTPLIPIEGFRTEFLGIINVLDTKANDRTIDFLLGKANTELGLTIEEKRLLQELILKNKR